MPAVLPRCVISSNLPEAGSARKTMRSGVSFGRMLLLPFFTKRSVKLRAKRHWQFIRLTSFVERDCLADVVHDHLAGVTPGHVLFEFLAYGWINRTIHVFVQHLKQFFAFHAQSLVRLEPPAGRKLQISWRTLRSRWVVITQLGPMDERAVVREGQGTAAGNPTGGHREREGGPNICGDIFGIEVEVRIIAATSQDLRTYAPAVDSGRTSITGWTCSGSSFRPCASRATTLSSWLNACWNTSAAATGCWLSRSRN